MGEEGEASEAEDGRRFASPEEFIGLTFLEQAKDIYDMAISNQRVGAVATMLATSYGGYSPQAKFFNDVAESEDAVDTFGYVLRYALAASAMELRDACVAIAEGILEKYQDDLASEINKELLADSGPAAKKEVKTSKNAPIVIGALQSAAELYNDIMFRENPLAPKDESKTIGLPEQPLPLYPDVGLLKSVWQAAYHVAFARDAIMRNPHYAKHSSEIMKVDEAARSAILFVGTTRNVTLQQVHEEYGADQIVRYTDMGEKRLPLRECMNLSSPGQ